MNEADMRKWLIDLILWTSYDRLKLVWSFTSSLLADEKIGIHADDDYLISHGEFLKEKRRKEERKKKKSSAKEAIA